MSLHLGLGQYVGIATYIAFIVGSILSLAWRPTVGLYFLILTIPQERLRSHLLDLPLGEHMLVFLLLSVLLGALLRGQVPKRSPLNKVLVVFCLFTFASLVIGTFYMGPATLLERARNWKDYMTMPLLFLATSAAIQTRKQFRTAIVLVCLSVLLVNRSVGLDIREHDNTHFDEENRQSGPLGNSGPNGIAAFESQMAVFLIALAAFEKKLRHKLLLYGLTALSVFCLLFSFSRGGYLAFLSAIFVYALVHKRKLLPILIVFVLAWQVFVPEAVVERVTMTKTRDGRLEDSAAARVTIWTDALNLIASSPILGSGYDTYEYMHRVGSFRDTHNFYLKTMVETGIVGLGIFFAILASFWRLGWTLFRRAKDDGLLCGLGLGVAICTVSIAVANFFGDRWSYLELNGLVWVLVGLVAFAHSELGKMRETETAEEIDLISRDLEYQAPWDKRHQRV